MTYSETSTTARLSTGSPLPAAIAVTDLDSTLVFTGTLDTPDTVCVDTYSATRGGLMAASAYDQYDALATQGRIVALTTRTVAEYSRMNLPQLPYALVANGTRLLLDGVEDDTWRQESLALIAELTPPADVHQSVADRLSGEPVKTACCDEAFVVVAVSRSALDHVDRIVGVLPDVPGYTHHRVGRKTYLLPEVLEKHLMLQRFWRRFGRPTVVTSAGDSTMDAGFVAAADYGFVPGCADLVTHFEPDQNITVTASQGVASGVEVMAGLANGLSVST